jgi:SSS family solute:Na+ symporter
VAGDLAASAGLLASSTLLANDIYARFFSRGVHNEVLVSCVFTLLLGVAVLGMSLVVEDVLTAITICYALLSGCLLVPLMGSLFWKRSTAAAALASMAVSSVVVVALLFTRGLTSNDPVIYGLLSSLLVFVAVSLLTPAPSPESTAAWERRLNGPVRADEPGLGEEERGTPPRNKPHH